MTKADKLVFKAAALLVLFSLTAIPARAQSVRTDDIMTQMAPMVKMVKAKMGTRHFSQMMQTTGPMMSQLMQGGTLPGGFGNGSFAPQNYATGIGGAGGN